MRLLTRTQNIQSCPVRVPRATVTLDTQPPDTKYKTRSQVGPTHYSTGSSWNPPESEIPPQHEYTLSELERLPPSEHATNHAPSIAPEIRSVHNHRYTLVRKT
jgi:hypothetical protein